MMQLKFVEFGKLGVTIYDAPDVGDILPMHSHDETSVHITIIARGSFKVHGAGWEMIAKAGDVLDWMPDQEHELIAIEPNSRFVNIAK